MHRMIRCGLYQAKISVAGGETQGSFSRYEALISVLTAGVYGHSSISDAIF